MPYDKVHRLVLFDCDGTLVDSQHNICVAMAAAFRARDHAPPTADAIRRTVGLPVTDSIVALSPNLPDDEVVLIREGYRDAFYTNRQREDYEEPLYPAAREILDKLNSLGYLLGIATGKSLPGLVATLERHQLTPYFVTLQTADSAPGKPHPGMVENAIADTGVEPKGVVVIGDTSFDMEMAKNAGVSGVGVAWGYHPYQELMDAGAECVIDSFHELPDLMDFMMGGREF